MEPTLWIRCGNRAERVPKQSSRSRPGDRVRMSAWGRGRHPKHGDRQGLIVGRGSPSSWRVKFDERKYVQALHQAYLEKVEQSGAGLSGRSDIKDIFELRGEPSIAKLRR